ncbi:unnamed protein product [Caenorhabditis auriculariae]|uniref:NADP-dependent oxidoreductase domain-containing protein n=1 Tax=Caenorhabditis auriculariae TaxID=2777116 RepID=A0A8S1HVP0_9PELO|nr:unnamed protein product [Caenorhabditis auriculariae]
MSVPSVTLNDGHKMPLLGLGTWQSEPGEVGKAVKTALELGYRHIDCAYAYLNQKEIGDVLQKVFAEGKIKREDVFITSKVWNTFHSYEKAKENIATILSELQLDYIDLILIHWPMGYAEGAEIFPKTEDGKKMRYSDVDYLETWKAAEEAKKSGKVRSIGISNFNHLQIDRLLDNSTIKPSVLQIELSPYLTQKKIRDYCDSKNIFITAYSPFGNPGSSMFRKSGDPCVLNDETIKKIAEKHGKTNAQIVLRWITQHNIIAIPKSTSAERLSQNFNVFDVELSNEEMNAIDGLNKNWRLVDIKERDGDHPHFPFNEEY